MTMSEYPNEPIDDTTPIDYAAAEALASQCVPLKPLAITLTNQRRIRYQQQ
jgi:hypothetical protein